MAKMAHKFAASDIDELILRVRHIGPEQIYPVREGMTLGGNPTNTIMVVHSRVAPFHAQVVRDPAGRWIVQSKLETAILVTSEGEPANEIVLNDGVEFRLGPARITSRAGPGRQAMAALEHLARKHRCPRCREDLAAVQEVAVFCPHCGMDLGVDASASNATPDMEQLNALLEQLFQNEGAGHAHSPAITAYVNTMYNLGWRYENGNGVLRNVEEALRYYRRAAAMGSQPAKRRLEKE